MSELALSLLFYSTVVFYLAFNVGFYRQVNLFQMAVYGLMI